MHYEQWPRQTYVPDVTVQIYKSKQPPMIPTLIGGEPERCAMVEVKELIRQADDLHELAKREKDPKVRHRLNRLADAYSHMAEIGSGAAPPSLHGLMDALTNSDDGKSAERSPAKVMPEPLGADSMKQTTEPRKRGEENEQDTGQDPGKASADAFARRKKTNTG
jgi:hypothetical protein